MEDSLAATRPDGGEGPARVDAAEPTKIGRYTVLRRLGVGGMGIVYVAYDTELDRKIAIKLLHRAQREGSAGTTRLIREAQAMAKISHPNVLQVYEVGEHAGQVFLALEYVEGSTLREWCTAKPRPWREIFRMFLQAGEGLMAAHAAGIIHRDFKPDNALVDRGGRVRVLDFGLARAAHAHEAEATHAGVGALGEGISTASGSLEILLTQPGAVVGTPAYMAPEQHLGQPIDARTDEFSLCVALWEALFGARPFSGSDVRSVRESVFTGVVREPPRGSPVPGWIRRALRRGLSIDPADRFPSVDALMAVLRDDPWVRRRRGLVVVATALAVVGGAYGYSAAVESAEAICRGGAERFAEVWDDARAEAMTAAFTATGRPYAAAAAEQVRERLDARATAWAEIFGDACETHRRGEASDDLLDRRMACLDRRRDEVDALVGVLTAADAEVVDRAIDAVEELGAVDACNDLAALQRRVEPPASEAREVVAAVRRRLDAAEAEYRAGRYPHAFTLVEPEVTAAEGLGYRPLVAEAMLTRAKIRAGLTEHEEAHADLLRAVWAAEASRHDEVAADAWILAVRSAGAELGHHEDASRWYERASAAVARLGDPPRTRAALLNARGAVALHAERNSEALRDFEEALALLRELSGDDDLQLANVHNNIGNALTALSRFDEARQALEETYELRKRHLGEVHPDVASAYNNLGVLYRKMGDTDEAYRCYERALAIWEASLGPDNPKQITALINLANFEYLRGDLDATIRLFGRAEALAARSLPPESPTAATLRGNLGTLHLVRGSYAAGVAMLSAEAERRAAVLGPESATAYSLLLNAAIGQTALGKYQEARELLTRPLMTSQGPAARARQGLMLVEGALALGELAAAEAYMREAEADIAAAGEPKERAFSLLAAEIARRRRDVPRAAALVREAPAAATNGDEVTTRATLEFFGAQALWEAKIDRPAARATAEAALADLRTRPEADPARAAAIEAWLAAPPR